MELQKVLMTGFGPFEEVVENPSGRLALELNGATLEGDGGRVVGATLPVSFGRAPQDLAALVERLRPTLILATGVHKGDGFRIERGAGLALRAGRPDADGVSAQQLEARAGTRLETLFDVERVAAVLAESGGAPVECSSDAGRYVCECIYRRALELGQEARVPALFLHVPTFTRVPFERQRAALLALVNDLSLQARDLSLES